MRNLVRTACMSMGIGAAHLLPPVPGFCQDWPQWRGPNRDGVVRGVTGPAKWPKALREEWKVSVGEGVASPVVAGGNVYVFTRQSFIPQKDAKKDLEKRTEVVRCLNLQRGEEVWRSEPYSVSFKPWVDANFPWPRSTPAVAGGKVYTLGIANILSCLDARTGTLLWRKHCEPPAGPAHNYGGNSPLVADGLCIVHVARIHLMASMVTGRSLSPSKTGSRPKPVPAWIFRRSVPPNHEAGSGRPVSTEAIRHALLHRSAPILRGRRSTRQDPVRPRPRPTGPDPLRRGPPAEPNAFLQAVQPLRSGLVVGAECMFAWYWLADLCSFFVRQRALWNAWRAPLGAHTLLFLSCLVL
jgi:PQQ-like domain